MKKKPDTTEWVSILEVPKGATPKQMSAAARAAADDLQMFAETKTWIPARQVVDELREMQRNEGKKRKRKR